MCAIAGVFRVTSAAHWLSAQSMSSGVKNEASRLVFALYNTSGSSPDNLAYDAAKNYW
jgi:hypothetical protein